MIVSYAGLKLAQAFVDDNTMPSFKSQLLFGQVSNGETRGECENEGGEERW